MKTSDLEILLQEGEGVLLEYKEVLSSSFARELVAFANTAAHPASTPQEPRKYPASTPQVLAVLNAALSGEKTREELQEAAGIIDREHFRKHYIEPLLSQNYLERTIPSKPRSSKQRYRITMEGRRALEASAKENEP
ncbi:MAG: hypothetical protein RDV48_22940 [Candidatus Eremiobacteraeota bacterium]|nr:hypothetical protein [Candidatus Eremiobacteraeota bacterium]